MAKIFTTKDIAALKKALLSLESAEQGSQLSAALVLQEKILSPIKKKYSTPTKAIKEFLSLRSYPEAYLAKILKSRSRASELLSGKKGASLSDIRALCSALDIPVELLLAVDSPQRGMDDSFTKRSPLINEMVKRGWLKEAAKKDPQEAFSDLCKAAGFSSVDNANNACFRQQARKNIKTDSLALQAWLLGVHLEAKKIEVKQKYRPKLVGPTLLEDIVHDLSASSKMLGSIQDYLAHKGIRFLMVRHLKGTYIDGAVFCMQDGSPVIALTGRYDRLDNFWFTLLHELAHLVLGHVSLDNGVIFDDMDIVPQDEWEIRADEMASDIVIPPSAWREFCKSRVSHSAIMDFALDLGISPAIVAGRIRFEKRDYRLFTQLIGHGEVRRYFPKAFGEQETE